MGSQVLSGREIAIAAICGDAVSARRARAVGRRVGLGGLASRCGAALDFGGCS